MRPSFDDDTAGALDTPDMSSTVTIPMNAATAARIAEAYAGVGDMDEDLAHAIVGVAANLGTNPFLLANMLRAESGFKARAVNPPKAQPAVTWRGEDGPLIGRATGLIQFTPPTAERLGTTTAEIERMSAPQQMELVEEYLDQFQPLNTEQRLYLAVFYPRAQGWPLGQLFPEGVRAGNPGINTPLDYINFVNRHSKLRADGHILGTRSVTVRSEEVPAVQGTPPNWVPIAGGLVVLGGLYILSRRA